MVAKSFRIAAQMVDAALKSLPDLVVHGGNLPATAKALRNLLAPSHSLFDRGVPVRVVTPVDGSPPFAIPLTKNNVIVEAHELCQPVKYEKDGKRVETTLSDRIAQMYLDRGEWDLRCLEGFSMSPLLSDDGTIRSTDGYDPVTRLWCCNVAEIQVPAYPSLQYVKDALLRIRHTFRTFPFSDAERISSDRLEMVDVSKPPGRDESAFLIGLMTACCRPSLPLAPGLLLTAPTLSGAGTGKGLLVRAICMIAFGIRPHAFTAGGDRAELDKRLGAELVEATPAVFLDNVNGTALRSDTLASVMTERRARVRILGQTRMVPLNSRAFIAVTGNGLTVTEDLARRFITSDFDARCEDPESRSFEAGFLEEIERRRGELLSAVLCVWRWGRQNKKAIPRGKPLGSFEEWTQWCRDPLLALGCQDPVQRIDASKKKDPERQRITQIFESWWKIHGCDPVAAAALHEDVKSVIDLQGRGRQFITASLLKLVGTRAAGFVLKRQETPGAWGVGTYSLQRIETSPVSAAPMPPMPPMPYAPEDEDVLAGHETKL